MSPLAYNYKAQKLTFPTVLYKSIMLDIDNNFDFKNDRR